MPPVAPAEDEWNLTGAAGKNQRKVPFLPLFIFVFFFPFDV